MLSSLPRISHPPGVGAFRSLKSREVALFFLDSEMNLPPHPAVYIPSLLILQRLTTCLSSSSNNIFKILLPTFFFPSISVGYGPDTPDRLNPGDPHLPLKELLLMKTFSPFIPGLK